MFTWPQKLLKMVEVCEDPGINGDVNAIPEQHEHISICTSKGVCVQVAFGIRSIPASGAVFLWK